MVLVTALERKNSIDFEDRLGRVIRNSEETWIIKLLLKKIGRL